MMGDKELKSDFAFLGSRNYIQGGILLEFILTDLWDSLPGEKGIQVEAFKIHREVNRNVLLRHGRLPSAETAAELSYRHGQTRRSVHLIPMGDRIEKREENTVPPVTVFSGQGTLAGTAQAENVKDYKDLVEGVVEFNKRLHLAYPLANPADPRVRVVYFRNFSAYKDMTAGTCKMEIKKIGEQEYRGLFYTFSEVHYELQTLKDKMEICFSYQRKA